MNLCSDSGRLAVSLLGIVDGTRQGVDLTSSDELAGSFNVDTGTFTLQLALSGTVFGSGVQLNAAVTASTFFNRAPKLGAVTATNTVAKGGSCSANVTLTVAASIPTTIRSASTWTASKTLLGTGTTITATLPIGTTNLVLQASDGRGSFTTSPATVVVTDGNPPVFGPVPPTVTVSGCGVGSQTIQLTVPTATNVCGETTPVQVTGVLIDWNGKAVEVPVSSGLAT